MRYRYFCPDAFALVTPAAEGGFQPDDFLLGWGILAPFWAWVPLSSGCHLGWSSSCGPVQLQERHGPACAPGEQGVQALGGQRSLLCAPRLIACACVGSSWSCLDTSKTSGLITSGLPLCSQLCDLLPEYRRKPEKLALRSRVSSKTCFGWFMGSDPAGGPFKAFYISRFGGLLFLNASISFQED